MSKLLYLLSYLNIILFFARFVKNLCLKDKKADTCKQIYLIKKTSKID